MRRASIIFLLLIAPAVHSQTAGVTASEWDVLRACSGNADPEVTGLTQLEQACPGLEASLAELGYLAFLSEQQREELSVYSLADLVHLGASAETANTSLHEESLQSVLQSLEEKSELQLSWWDRLENWVAELLRRRAQESSLLDAWLEKVQPSEVLVRTTLYALVALVVLLAIALVINELRGAGVLKRRGSSAQRFARGSASNQHAEQALSIGELDRVPIENRPAALLRVIVAALVRAGRLRSERSLTYRELSREASFTDHAQRESFERIARAAEGSVYGGRRFSEADVASLVQEGQQLHERLQGRAA